MSSFLFEKTKKDEKNISLRGFLSISIYIFKLWLRQVEDGGKQTRALTIYLRKPILMNFQIASIYKYYISNFSL